MMEWLRAVGFLGPSKVDAREVCQKDVEPVDGSVF
jgi:hypothetical protein